MATLGPATMDFVKLQFQFRLGTTEHHWQGESGLAPSEVNFQSLRRMSDTNAFVACYCLHLEAPLAIESVIVLAEMEELLTEFATVFMPPQGLPPPRDTDHAIHLQPMSKPVNVRPYRYP